MVAVDDDVASLLRGLACVPDVRDELHPVRELLADLRRIDQEERVAPHGARTVLQPTPQRLAVQVPARPLLRVDGAYVVVYRTDYG